MFKRIKDLIDFLRRMKDLTPEGIVKSLSFLDGIERSAGDE